MPSQGTVLLLPRGTDENHENFRIAVVSTEIRTDHLTNMNIELYF
jgi:hypothetical protein